MHSPILAELPPPPLGKIGWPWTEDSSQLPDRMPDGRPWPKISIVTPSYNQGQFIEETIRSVLLQGYPNLEYLIVDGNSTDQSRDIIKKYGKYLLYWISEPDKGQADAINKGIAQITGNIFTYINSDDSLTPNALLKVASYFIDHPESSSLRGGYKEVDKAGTVIKELIYEDPISWEDMVLGKTCVHQPGGRVFLKVEFLRSVGHFQINLKYTFDLDFFIRFLMKNQMESLPAIFSCVRIHNEAKTQKLSNIFDFSKERYEVLMEYLPKIKGKRLSKAIAFRSLRLCYITSSFRYKKSKFVQRISLLMKEPILWTSPSFLKKLFIKDKL